MEVSVIKPASEVMSRIGDPKPLVTESKMDQQQQEQPQRNGTGHTQHNMAGVAYCFAIKLCFFLVWKQAVFHALKFANYLIYSYFN